MTPAIVRNKQITIADLEKLKLPIEFDGENILLRKSLRLNSYHLDTPVSIPLQKVLAAHDAKLVDYVIRSLLTSTPRLIIFVFDNKTMIKVADHLLRNCSGSLATFENYASAVKRYSGWLNHSPDAIIQDLQIEDDEPDKIRAKNHRQFLKDFLAELQDAGLAPNSITSTFRAVHSYYNINGAKAVRLDQPLKQRKTFKDRAPKPEELVLMLDSGDHRDSFIIAALATGGFREETLSKLKYRHIKEDYEANRIPLHVHVEAAIVKGKYGDYDTFLNREAVNYLRLYLKQRQKGGRFFAPEVLTDESPLIRNRCRANKILPASTQTIYRTVHDIAVECGVAKKLSFSRMYDVREHSIRKYFKTQLSASSINDEIIEYMMGHITSTYEDTQSLGIDKLRELYASANVTIRKATKLSKIEQIKEMIRACGENPEQILTQEVLNRPEAVLQQSDDQIQFRQLNALTQELREIIKRESK